MGGMNGTQKAVDEFLKECVKQKIPIYAAMESYEGIMIVLTELLRRTAKAANV